MKKLVFFIRFTDTSIHTVYFSKAYNFNDAYGKLQKHPKKGQKIQLNIFLAESHSDILLLTPGKEFDLSNGAEQIHNEIITV